MWKHVLIAILVVVYLIGVFSYRLFRRFRWYQKFACKIGWHSYPSFDTEGFDGCSVHAKCKWCGYKGMIDSQGNLF